MGHPYAWLLLLLLAGFGCVDDDTRDCPAGLILDECREACVLPPPRDTGLGPDTGDGAVDGGLLSRDQ